jgi:hypothetical protein
MKTGEIDIIQMGITIRSTGGGYTAEAGVTFAQLALDNGAQILFPEFRHST